MSRKFNLTSYLIILIIQFIQSILHLVLILSLLNLPYKKTKMSSIFAEIDVEIAAHFGDFKNIDLYNKGIYAIRVTLFYGQQEKKIAPTGIFSAPSKLYSWIGDSQVYLKISAFF
jgi:hypothetical protein